MLGDRQPPRDRIEQTGLAVLRVPSEERSQLLETAFRGMLSVGLYAAFPAFSDVYRLWRRQAGVVPGELAPEAFEYPPVAAAIWEPMTWLPSARAAVVVNGILMVLAAVGITRLLQRYAEEKVVPDIGLWVASPALLILLPMNWDVGIAFVLIAGVGLLVSGVSTKAGFALGFGFAWKIAPGSVFLPLLPLLDGWHRRLKFLFAGGVTVGGAYAAYILLRPDIWRIHLDFASMRDDYRQTIWEAVNWAAHALGYELSVAAFNVASLATLVLALILLTIWVGMRRPTFAEAAALAITVFVLFNKVFKPAYVLWLVPVLALTGARRSIVRAIEGGAIAYFAIVFFPIPRWISPVAAVVTIVALFLVIIEIGSRYRTS